MKIEIDQKMASNDSLTVATLHDMLCTPASDNLALIRTVGRLSRIAELAERLLSNATPLQEQFNPESFEVLATDLMELSKVYVEFEMSDISA